MRRSFLFFRKKSAPALRNAVLTGPPCAGKTFTAALLDGLHDTVVLTEPMGRGQFEDPDTVLRETDRMFWSMRRSLLEEGIAIVKEAPPSAVVLKRTDNRRRIQVRFGKTLSRDFLLAIEHSAGFTAVLPEMAKQYPCYAVVRNPLVLLACWSRHRAPVLRGYLPVAERLDKNLGRMLSETPDPFDRQIHILSWFFEKYSALPPARVLKYEDIISSGGRALGVVAPGAEAFQNALESRNRAELEGWTEIREAGPRLLAADGPFWRFYSRESVVDLIRSVS